MNALPSPPPRRNKGLVIGLGAVAGGLVLLTAAAIAIAALSSPGKPKSSPPAKKGEAAIEFRRVEAQTAGACSAEAADRLTASDSSGCFTLGAGLTVAAPRNVALKAPGPATGGTYAIIITLQPADGTRLTTLTAQLAQLEEPRNRLAIVVGGHLVSAPLVQQAITGNDFQISGNFTRKTAQRYVDLIRG